MIITSMYTMYQSSVCFIHQVSPVDIESVLLKHDSVSEAAVVGLPHQKHGELITAVVIIKPGHNVTQQELNNFSEG